MNLDCVNNTAIKLVISHVEYVAENILKIIFNGFENQDLPLWEAGSHLEIRLSSGFIRHYSLCGHADDRKNYEIAVLLEPNSRGGSLEIHQQWKEGEIVEILSIRNNFPLKNSKAITLIAGGIGITPILAMAREADLQGIDFKIYYGGRSLKTMAYLDELKKLPAMACHILPEDENGLLNIKDIVSEAVGTDIYACGPSGLLRALKEETQKQHVNFYMEMFSADKQETSSKNENSEFVIELKQSDLTLSVAKDKSILQTLIDADIDVLWSCGEGICGTCAIDVCEGVPDHRDNFLTDIEKKSNQQIMCCVSRCKGKKLVLDI